MATKNSLFEDALYWKEMFGIPTEAALLYVKSQQALIKNREFLIAMLKN